MTRHRPALALLALLASTSSLVAQAFAPQTFAADPANLRGEQVRPLDGRELPVDQGARGLEQTLRRLRTRASLMLIVAHPDDEDSGMLTLYSRGEGAHVAMLTLTRGEGGQNAMTGDFEDALGLLRTQELLAEDRYSGVDQMFGTEVDFGFSKTKEEAFAKWTHERVLYDAVRAVRLCRPLVVAAVFIGGVTDGHGHHQVSGEIAQEVFKAAGDPNVFPDQIADGLQPWSPVKVYARVPMGAITERGLFDYATGQYAPARFTNYVTGEVSTTTPSEDVVIHEGTPDPLLVGPEVPGRDSVSYVQFARTGLALQKSQMGGGMRTPSAGTWDVSYHRYGSHLPADKQKEHEESFFDGIDTSLTGIATLAPYGPLPLKDGLTKLSASIDRATGEFKPADPSACAPALADAQKQLNALLATLEESSFDGKADVLHELRVKQVQLNQALTLALGLHLDATSKSADEIVHTDLPIGTNLHTTAAMPLTVDRVWLRNSEGETYPAAFSAQPTTVPSGQPFDTTLSTGASFTSTITRPPFHRANIETPFYEVANPTLRNAPLGPPAAASFATIQYNGVPVTIGRVVHKGPEPLAFIPEVSVFLPSHAQVLPETSGASPLEDTLGVLISTAPSSTTVQSRRLILPNGWHATLGKSAALPSESRYMVSAPKELRAPATIEAQATTPDGKSFTEGFRPVGYAGLPRTNLFTPATLRVVPIALNLPLKGRIAYLPGTGDSVADDLRTVGLDPQILTVADVNAARLAQFDTVVLGVRTYAAHPDLHGAPTEALFAFARNGGNVIVQYQTGEFGGGDAPFPLSLGRDAEKVVDETDPVTLAPSRVLTSPNALTAADFNGWVEERGHGFLRSWDPQYTTPTECHDPGQDPQRGGIATVRLGKGHWTYVAFALYRQLPEAVPGGFRLFSNLLALADEE